MISRPDHPAMTTPVGVVHPDVPNRAVRIGVVRRAANAVVDRAANAVVDRAANAVVDRVGTGRDGTTRFHRVAGPAGVTEPVTEGMTGEVRTEHLEAAQTAMVSGADRCSRRRSRGCLSRRSPMT
jgi:hypothetical protein